MKNAMPSIRQFQSLVSAINFISECVETTSAVILFNQTMASEIRKGNSSKEADYFIKYTFPQLQRQFEIMDFRIRYKNHSFPESENTFTVGGHDKELGHIHIDFLKHGDNWIIKEIWQCR